MNLRLLASAAAVVAAASTLPLSPPAGAATAIQRCLSSDGTFAYTDKGCATLGAEALPMPRELEGRIARDDDEAASATRGDRAADPLAREAVAAPGRRSPASGCARSPRQLATDLRASLVLGDVNRLAESYHWAGMSSRAGERTLERLERLSRREVVDAAFYDARAGTVDVPGFADTGTLLASAAPHGNGASTGVIELVLGNGARSVVDFDVHRYAGCYFVTF